MTDAEIQREWEHAEDVAAERRLTLAQRYQREHVRLDLEWENLRASIAWLTSQLAQLVPVPDLPKHEPFFPHLDSAALEKIAQVVRALISYVNALAPYVQTRGRHKDLQDWCIAGIRGALANGQRVPPLWLLRSEAQNALGDWQGCGVSLQAALESSLSCDPITYARALAAFGRLQLERGDHRRALVTLVRAEALLERQQDVEGLASVRMELAAYHLNRRELDQALKLYHAVDELRRQVGAETSQHTLMMLGVVHRKMGHYELAEGYLSRMMARGRQMGNAQDVAVACHHLAWAYLERGMTSRARSLCGEAIDLFRSIGHFRGLSDAYEQLGCVELADGRIAEAIDYLDQSLSMRRQLGNRQGAASSLRRLAAAYLRRGQRWRAGLALCRSVAIYLRIGALTYPMAQEIWWDLRHVSGGPRCK